MGRLSRRDRGREGWENRVAEDDQLIAGRYRLSTRVGSGAMGVVWRAEDERLRRTVALKQVRLPGEIDDQTHDRAYRRVMREGRLFARLHHPNAIAVFDVVDHADQPWLVMEYLPSQSLSEAVAAHGVLAPLAAASVGHQVAAALAAAHTAGIVHRDIKPGNVLLGPGGIVKVTDFGISRAIDEATVTSSGMMAGTPAYLAPEVARGAEADFRSDVYSLGSTLYAAVEGEPPFGQGENALAQLYRVATGEYTPPQRAGVLAPLLERLLADDPTRRPEMHQVRDELGHLAAVDAETDEWHETSPSSGGPTPTVPPAPTDGVRELADMRAGAAPGAGTGQPGPPHRVTVAAARPPTPPRLSASTTPVSTVSTPTGGPGSELRSSEHQDPPTDDGQKRRRRGRLLGVGIAVVMLLVVVVVAVVLGTRSDGGATAGEAAPTTAGQPGATGTDQASAPGDGSATPGTGTPDQVAQQQAIIDYYALIPSNLPEGWQRLTPSYQQNTAGGFAAYTRFWGSMRQTAVRGVSPGAGDTVDATVTYVYDGGRTSEERTLFRMVQQDGVWKIDGSQVVSSR
jgi:serine/threonine protein kinase